MNEKTKDMDRSDMKQELIDFPEFWKEGLALASSIDGERLDRARIGNVVVAGMGGSAIGGDLMRTFCQDTAPLPVMVHRGYGLPGYVDEHTLVVVSSYSGNTEETLSAFDEALRRESQVLCITSGGQVADRAGSLGLPLVVIPGGHPPRAALPYSLACLMRLAVELDLTDVADGEWDEALGALREGVARLGNEHESRALELAREVAGCLLLVYSGPGFLEGVNLRWRGQWEENAKTLAYGNLYPELNHNEIVGWDHSAGLLERIAVIAFHDREDGVPIRKRASVTRSLLAERCALWRDVATDGEGRLARMLSLIQLGDWTSYYLALRNGVDPTPVELIDRLKAELAST